MRHFRCEGTRWAARRPAGEGVFASDVPIRCKALRKRVSAKQNNDEVRRGTSRVSFLLCQRKRDMRRDVAERPSGCPRLRGDDFPNRIPAFASLTKTKAK